MGGLLACSHNEIIIGTLKFVALYVARIFFALLPLKGKKNNLRWQRDKEKRDIHSKQKN